MTVLSVTGIRGKSSVVTWMEQLLRGRGHQTLAKVTGDYPLWIYNGEYIPIQRKRVVSLRETLAYKNFSFDYFVAENQAIGPYTMKVFNDIIKPDVALVTNVRLDHTNRLGSSLKRIAKSLGQGIGPYPKIILSSEIDAELNTIFARNLRAKQNFITTNTKPGTQVPMEILIGLVNCTFQNIGIPQLTIMETDRIKNEILESLRVKRCPAGLRYFDGAKINDVNSTQEIFTYLRQQYPDKVFDVVAYFRKDRVERTLFFLPWLKELTHTSNIHIHMVGYGAQETARRLKNKNRVTVWEDSQKSVQSICSQSKDKNSIIFLSCNAVNTFMRTFRAQLQQ